MEMKEKFKKLILNDIFYFDKSELNFGIYKIFRQKQKLIENLINEIIEEVEKELSNNSEVIKKVLKDELPPKIFRELNFENNDIEKIKKQVKEYIDVKILEKIENNNYSPNKIYEYLYQFFNLYYETGDFGYTNRSFDVYKVPFKEKIICEDSQEANYKGEETLFTWKTKDSYYIKSNKFLNTLTLKLNIENNEYIIKADVVGKDDIKDDKKIKQYRLISITKQDNMIFLKFNLSDNPTPKHTIYLLILTLINCKENEINYDDFDEKIKKFFEELPIKKTTTSSLFDNSKEVIDIYKKMLERYQKYLIKDNKNIFIFKLTGEEDKQQIKSKISKLMLTKKDYAKKVYKNKTEAKKFLEAKKFDFDNKKDLKTLYEKDKLLDFFYKLDRGINLFFAGVDSDYFIHKNLKRFLLTELDKFIKNYIFTDTDAMLNLEDTTIFKFAKIFKKEAIKIIELLNSIEEFQKYIWEKRKLIKQTEYIISSNKINDINLLQKILKNRKQTQEWLNLGLCKDIPNLIELQSYPYPIDTKNFLPEKNEEDYQKKYNEYLDFKFALLSQFDDLEKEIDGILIKSENFQALKFLEPKFKEQIKCIYIDPPYNTGNDGFVYKDNYKESSWLSMMNDRLEIAKELMKDDGVIFSSIDDRELFRLKLLLDLVYKEDNFIGNLIIENNPKGRKNSKFISVSSEYCLSYAKDKEKSYFIENIPKDIKDLKKDSRNRYYTDGKRVLVGKSSNKKVINFEKNDKHYSVYYNKDKSLLKISKEYDVYKENSEFIKQGYKRYISYKIENGKKVFIENTYTISAFEKLWINKALIFKEDSIYEKDFNVNTRIKSLIINKKEYNAIFNNKEIKFKIDLKTETANTYLKDLFGISEFNNPKNIGLLQLLITLFPENNQYILDFFAGSGTTGDAVIRLNKEDRGNRKFILVELNDYFESIIIPRIKKVSFSAEWKDVKAQKIDGIGGVYQYIYLEQYDEIIDNLKTKDEIEKMKVEAKYIYNPEKNKIAFRIEKDIKNPLNPETKFDIFHSLIFHKGFKLKKIKLENNTLIGELYDDKVVILGENENETIKQINKYKDKEIYTNIKYPNTTQIDVYTFKGI